MDSYDIIHAAQNQALNTYPPADAKETIRASVDRAYNLAEVQRPGAIDYEQTIDNITGKILTSYPYLTAQEIALVADAGVAGELGGRTKPSAAAFFGWLASYVNSDIRKEAIRNYRRSNTGDPATREPTRAEKDEMNRRAEVRALRTLWQEFKDRGRFASDHLDGYIAMACDAFIKRRYMTVTDEHWRMAKEAARKEAHRALGSGWIDRALPYDPVFKTKRIMLAMCFQGLKDAGYELEVNA